MDAVSQECIWEIEDLIKKWESALALAGRSASPPRRPPHGREHDRQAGEGIWRLELHHQDDGSLKTWINGEKLLVLPPLLGHLLAILASNDLGESDDAWVGWKTPDQVSQLLETVLGRRPALNHAIYRLRRALVIKAGLPPGLVQRDPRRGLRLLLSRPGFRADPADHV
jgi:hypothetical protein